MRQEGSQAAKEQLAERIEEVVADKGYHSNDVLTKLEEVDVRSYIPEPARGRRNWKNKDAERDAVRRNQRRIKRKKGKALQRKRSELVERPFAHFFVVAHCTREHARVRGSWRWYWHGHVTGMAAMAWASRQQRWRFRADTGGGPGACSPFTPNSLVGVMRLRPSLRR